VVNLFTKNFSSDDSKVFFVDAGTKTQAGAYSLQVAYDGSGKMTSATINGKAATIDGELIRGATGTDTEGLVLGFTPPGNGAGTLSTNFHFSQGVAGTLAAVSSQLTDDTTGTIHFATDDLTQANTSLDTQISAWDDRLATTEERLRKQFTSLETLIGQLKNQGDYISATLG
jgi:hypothetical protein